MLLHVNKGRSMSGRLLGKIAIVTGAASGVGESVARLFVREGAKVLMTDLNQADGVRIAAEIGATFVRHDVTDPAGWQQVVNTAIETFVDSHRRQCFSGLQSRYCRDEEARRRDSKYVLDRGAGGQGRLCWV